MSALRDNLNPQRLRVLLKLHLLLSWRFSMEGKALDKLAAAAAILVVFFISTGCAVAGFVLAFKFASDSTALHLIPLLAGVALLCIYLLLGLFQEGLGSGIDVSLLFHLPVSEYEMVASGFFSRFLSPWGLPPTALFAGFTLGGLSGGNILFGLSMPIAAALWCAQAFLLLMAGDYLLFFVRRSRRLAEFAGIAVMTVIMGWIIFQQFFFMRSPSGHSFGGWGGVLVAFWHSYGRVVLLLPGFSTVGWVGSGAYGVVIIAAAIAETLLLLWACFLLLHRLMDKGMAVSAGKRKHVKSRAVKRGAGPIAALPGWPVFIKDLRYYFRDPFLKTMLIGIMAGPLIIVAIFLLPSHFRGSSFIQYFLPYLVLIYFGQLAGNHLAMERAGLVTSLISPLPRWRLLLGKNMALMVPYLAVTGVVAAIAFRGNLRWAFLAPELALAISLGLIYFGCSNYTAVLLPVPMAPKGKRLRAQIPVGRMLLVLFVHSFVLMIASSLAIPVFLARYALVRLGANPLIAVVVSATMVIYALIAYGILLVGISRLMPTREPAIYAMLVRSQR